MFSKKIVKFLIKKIYNFKMYEQVVYKALLSEFFDIIK